jgi:hypothetical protein
MHLAQLLPYFETSPAVRLLRSPNAPFILDFLHQQFKKAGCITVPFSSLHAALVAYCEMVKDCHPEALRDRPESYLVSWCSADTRWLHRFLEEGRSEPVYQLTPHTETVLTFLDGILGSDQEFVGTESRLRLVIDTLGDLVVGASDDPETRLDHLRKEKERIEEEISRIESDGLVARYRPTQIRERFAVAVSLLKQLQGDFRAVEERFKEITRSVQERQVAGRDTRGEVLAFALDAEDVLKREDQGLSFHEFVRFILSPTQQERLQTIIGQLNLIRELSDQVDGLNAVRRMVPQLLAEAEKVMRTNQRLSATLRRLLDARTQRDRQRVGQLCGQILGLAAALAGAPPRDTVGVEVETRAGIASPFARLFWHEPPRFRVVDLAEQEDDEERRAEAFRALAQMRRLDWRQMRDNVKSAVARHGSVTLGGLLGEHPPTAGVIEALGYVQIAREDGHLISAEAVEEIAVPSSRDGDHLLALTVPLVRFIVSND